MKSYFFIFSAFFYIIKICIMRPPGRQGLKGLINDCKLWGKGRQGMDRGCRVKGLDMKLEIILA